MWFVLVILFILSSRGSSQPDSERSLRIVTWNVNGVRKFSHLPAIVSFIADHDLVLLQETFSYKDEELFELRGFLGHHARALPVDGSRNMWGLSTLFRTRSFSDGFLERISSPCDWVLVSRWRQPGQPGLMVLNIYAPLHSGLEIIFLDFVLLIRDYSTVRIFTFVLSLFILLFSPFRIRCSRSHITLSDVRMLGTIFDDMLQSYPGDRFVLGGDFNVDRRQVMNAAQLTPMQQ